MDSKEFLKHFITRFSPKQLTIDDFSRNNFVELNPKMSIYRIREFEYNLYDPDFNDLSYSDKKKGSISFFNLDSLINIRTLKLKADNVWT